MTTGTATFGHISENPIEIGRIKLAAALVIRDRILNKFCLVNEWNISDIPLTPISLKDELSAFSNSNRLDICAYIIPIVTKNRGENIASQRGDILSRKIFKIQSTSKKSKFPKRWATPEEFEEQGLPFALVFLVAVLLVDFYLTIVVQQQQRV